MSLTAYILCFSFYITTFLHLSDGIRCYRCDSRYVRGCGDPFDYTMMAGQSVDCDFGSNQGQFGQPGFGGQQGQPGQFGNQGFPGQQGQQGQFGNQFGGPGQFARATTCSKNTHKNGDTWIVTRDCGIGTGSLYGSSSSSNEPCVSQGGGYSCSCYGDNCNGANKGSAVSWLTLALMAALTFIFSR